MGLFDIFRKKKKERERLERQEAEARRKADEQRRQAEDCSRAEEQRMDYILSNFDYNSNCHQRYENGTPVLGLQVCPRYFKIRKNTSGCSGYQLKNGDGYILTATNGDTGKPQFAPKPMRVVKFTDTEILLKGYTVSAQTPFGWQHIDLSDYGFSIILNDGKPKKCVLHMYDRNVRLEYMIKNDESSASQIAISPNIQKIIDAATIGVTAAQKSNRRLEQECLINLYNLTQARSGQLLQIPADKYNIVGTGFCLLLEYPQVRANEDISRAIADYAFFCISKAIEYDSGNKTLYLKRVSVLAQTRKFFFYTVANALRIPDTNPLDIMLSAPLIVRTNEYIYAMGKYDFENGNKIAYQGILREFHDLCYGLYIAKTAENGKTYIDKVNDYIECSIRRYM